MRLIVSRQPNTLDLWCSVLLYSIGREMVYRLVNCFSRYLVLSTELIMWIRHRKEIRKLMFRALALLRSESRNCGLCVVKIEKYGATLLVGAWQRKKQQNKLVEWKELRNVSFRISLPWPINIINSVDKTKLSRYKSTNHEAITPLLRLHAVFCIHIVAYLVLVIHKDFFGIYWLLSKLFLVMLLLP